MLHELCPKCPTIHWQCGLMCQSIRIHVRKNKRHMNFARANVGTMLKYTCQAVCHMKFARWSDDTYVPMCVTQNVPEQMSEHMLNRILHQVLLDQMSKQMSPYSSLSMPDQAPDNMSDYMLEYLSVHKYVTITVRINVIINLIGNVRTYVWICIYIYIYSVFGYVCWLFCHINKQWLTNPFIGGSEQFHSFVVSDIFWFPSYLVPVDKLTKASHLWHSSARGQTTPHAIRDPLMVFNGFYLNVDVSAYLAMLLLIFVPTGQNCWDCLKLQSHRLTLW